MKLFTLAALFALPLLAFATPTKYSNASATALTTTPVLISSTPCTVSHYNFYNPNSTVAYVVCYDAASAGSVTVGTTHVDYAFTVPPFGVTDGPTVAGVPFNTGLVIAAVATTPGGSSAPGSGLWVSITSN